jgi:hypothetical protein
VRLLERLAVVLVPGENPTGAVYGLLTTGALLAAESGLHEHYPDTLLSVLLAAVAYWLLHAYARVLGGRLAERRILALPALAAALRHDWAILRGAAIPLAVLVVAWAAGASQATGASAALWSAIAGLVLIELLAAVRVRAAPAELALELGVGLAMGFAVLGVKAILH